MPEKKWIHLANGWTVSVSDVGVAAWPSSMDGVSPSLFIENGLSDWFTFKDGSVEARCFSAEDVVNAILEVENAPPRL